MLFICLMLGRGVGIGVLDLFLMISFLVLVKLIDILFFVVYFLMELIFLGV